MLTGYGMMWMLIMFDLPVQSRKERKEAAGFRNFLLDQGFQMCQFSVYLRFCGGKERVEAYTGRISKNLPTTGNVQVLSFTDKQYENIVIFDGRNSSRERKNPSQYTMF